MKKGMGPIFVEKLIIIIICIYIIISDLYYTLY